MEIISSGEITVIIRILVAVALGFMIGLQRERRKFSEKTYGSAGLRTHALVCLGSALIVAVIMVLNPPHYFDNLAVIMTGIGFLGAGTIIAVKGKIRGLVNAATIWISASIGITVGLGFYTSSVTATILTLLILELKRFEKAE